MTQQKRLGRPPTGNAKQNAPIRVSAAVKAYLDSTGNRSAEVERLARASKRFREWLSGRQV